MNTPVSTHEQLPVAKVQCPKCGNADHVYVSMAKNPAMASCSACHHFGSAMDWVELKKLKDQDGNEWNPYHDLLPTCTRCGEKTSVGLTRVRITGPREQSSEGSCHDLCQSCSDKLWYLLNHHDTVVTGDPYRWLFNSLNGRDRKPPPPPQS